MKLCIHRGHEIPEGCTKCPYHGLRAGLERLPEVYDVDVKENNSLCATDLESFNHKKAEWFFVYEQQVKAPYYLWMQNTMDFNHLDLVHPEFSKMFEGRPEDVKFDMNGCLSRYRIKIRKTIIEGFEHLLRQRLEPYFYHLTSFPNFSLTSFAGVFLSSELALKNLEGCKVRTVFYKAKDKELPEEFYENAKIKNAKILQEDKAICESWAKTYHNHEHKHWLPDEERIRVYVDLLKKYEPYYSSNCDYKT